LVVVASLLVLASLAQADLFDAYLYGTNVVSNIASPPTANGDLDGVGTAVVSVTASSICLSASWSGLATVTRYHIHKEAFGNRGAGGGQLGGREQPWGLPQQHGQQCDYLRHQQQHFRHPCLDC
jgi:hypothetical protein